MLNFEKLKNKFMKSIFTLLLVLVSFATFSQTPTPYAPFTRPNLAVVQNVNLEVEQGEPIYYLNYASGLLQTTYILTDWQGSVGNVPTVFAAGWSLNITYSPCKKTIVLRPPNTLNVVLDANYNSYLILD